MTNIGNAFTYRNCVPLPSKAPIDDREQYEALWGPVYTGNAGVGYGTLVQCGVETGGIGIAGGRRKRCGCGTWSAMILDDGAMTATVAAEESGFVVFGQCLPADKTRP